MIKAPLAMALMMSVNMIEGLKSSCRGFILKIINTVYIHF